MKLVRLLMVAFLAVIGGIGLWADGEQPAYACSCMPMTAEEAIENSDAVARVTITEASLPPRPGDVAVYLARVDEVWKGDVGATILITATTDDGFANCGVTFDEGDQRRLWLYLGDDGTYGTSVCAYPHDSSTEDTEAALAALGGPSTPEPRPDDPTGIPRELRAYGPIPPWAWIIGGAAGIAGVVLIVVLGRRR